jgi:homocysteine S-methyltransferase
MTTILDGGLATQLEAHGHDLSDRLWSARLLLTDPDAIEDVHLAYFRAGAQVATTASYQASIPGFASVGLDAATALSAIRRSVELADRARQRVRAERDAAGAAADELLVAGSIGPYGAMLADGSEYRGDYDPGPAALRELHAPRMDALLEAGVDVLAIETIPSAREAGVLIDLVAERDARAWLSFQAQDDAHIADGTLIETAIAMADGHDAIVAVGVNCTAPRHVRGLLDRMAAATDRPLIAYPNGGDRWVATDRRWVADDSAGGFDAVEAASWSRLGVAWLGGCCGTGPSDITALARQLANPRSGGDRSLDPA